VGQIATQSPGANPRESFLHYLQGRAFGTPSAGPVARNAMGLRVKRRARPHRLLITLGDFLGVAGDCAGFRRCGRGSC
jgi:hypothetical protein